MQLRSIFPVIYPGFHFLKFAVCRVWYVGGGAPPILSDTLIIASRDKSGSHRLDGQK